MYNNKNAKRGQAKLLAALAVFAMVACVFAAVPMMAEDNDAAITGTYEEIITTNSSVQTLVADKIYYLDAIDASTNGFMAPSTGSATLVVEVGAELKVTENGTGSLIIVTVPAATTNPVAGDEVNITDLKSLFTLKGASGSDTVTITVADGKYSIGTSDTFLPENVVLVGVASADEMYTIAQIPETGFTTIASNDVIVTKMADISGVPEYSFIVNNSDASTSVQFNGPFMGADAKVAEGASVALTFTTSGITSGSVEVVTGSVTATSVDGLVNGYGHGTATTSFTAYPNPVANTTLNTTTTSTVIMFVDTELSYTITMDGNGSTADGLIAELKSGFKTGSEEVVLAGSSTTAVSITSAERWTGEIYTSVATAIQGAGIGNISVLTAETNVTFAAATTLAGKISFPTTGTIGGIILDGDVVTIPVGTPYNTVFYHTSVNDANKITLAGLTALEGGMDLSYSSGLIIAGDGYNGKIELGTSITGVTVGSTTATDYTTIGEIVFGATVSTPTTITSNAGTVDIAGNIIAGKITTGGIVNILPGATVDLKGTTGAVTTTAGALNVYGMLKVAGSSAITTLTDVRTVNGLAGTNVVGTEITGTTSGFGTINVTVSTNDAFEHEMALPGHNVTLGANGSENGGNATKFTVLEGYDLEFKSGGILTLATSVVTLEIQAGASFKNSGTINGTAAFSIVLLGQDTADDDEETRALFTNNGTITTDAAAKNITLTLTAGTTAQKTAFINNGSINYTTDSATNGNVLLTANLDTVFTNNGNIDLGVSSFIGKVTNGKNGEIQVNGNIAIGTSTGASGTYKGTVFQNDGYMNLLNTTPVTITVNEDSTFNNDGAVDTPNAAAGAKITGDGTFNNGKKGEIVVMITTQYVTGVSYVQKIEVDMADSVTYRSIYHLIVPEGYDLDVRQLAQINIQGVFEVNGTLEVYGKLYIGCTGQAAELLLNGNIVIKDGGELHIGENVGPTDANAKAVIKEGVNVIVEDGGLLCIGSTEGVNFNVNGSLEMQKGSMIEGSNINVATTGTLNLNGYIVGNLVIFNKGNVVIDNGDNGVADLVANTVNITMAADAATVTIASYLVRNNTSGITVTDSGAVIYDAPEGQANRTVDATNCNTVTIGYTNTDSPSKVVIDGDLVIKAAQSSKVVTGQTERAINYGLDISGAVAGAFTYTGTVPDPIEERITLGIFGAQTTYFDETVVGKDIGSTVISDELTIGAYVLASYAGIITVDGTIDNTAAKSVQMENDGVLFVNGLIITSNEIENTDGTINAVMAKIINEVDDEDVTTYWYSTLDAIVNEIVKAENINTDKTATIMGDAKVLDNVTVPAGVNVVFEDDEATLTVGSTKIRDIVMLMEDGATLESSDKQITVYATLTFKDKNDDDTSGNVCDVTVQNEDDDNGFITYTNIYSAVEEATKSGEDQTVTVTRAIGDGKVQLNNNLTIPKNVTLVIQSNDTAETLELLDGVTLTVNGKIVAGQDIYAKTRFADKAMNVEDDDDRKSSAVIVNGVLVMDNISAFTYGAGSADTKNLSASAPVAGAYFQTEDGFFVTNVEYAMDCYEDVISTYDISADESILAIKVYGAVNAGNLALNAGEAPIALVVMDADIQKIGSSDMIETAMTVDTLTLNADSSLIAVGEFTGAVAIALNELNVAKIAGLTVTNVDEAMVLTGDVQAAKDTSVFTVSKGIAYLGIDKGADFTYTTTATEAVYMTIAEGASADVVNTGMIEALKVDGTVTVKAKKTLEVVVAIIYGTMDVASATDTTEAGNFIADVVFIGITWSDMWTAGVPTYNGPMDAGYAFVIAGATVSEEALDEMASTEFYVDGALWFTAYVADDIEDKTITVEKAPIDNVKLTGWNADENYVYGEDSVENFFVDVETEDRVHAIVETHIYTVYVIENPGVANVYIDGQQMNYGMIKADDDYFYGYYLDIAAGEHTLSYDLSNGWSGDASITVNGTPVLGGLGFTTVGDEYDDYPVYEYTIQISGLEKSGYVDPVDPADKDSGMGLTDYLLIVLVVLVVILAILVAVRMMRS